MAIRFIIWAMWACVLLIAAPAAAQPEGQYEGAAFGVEHYGVAGECSGADLSWSNNDADEVRTALSDMGYEQTTYNTNQDVDDFRWADSTLFPTWGADNQDPSGTDFADVIFHSGHGTRSCGTPAYSSITMGSYWIIGGRTQVCSIRTDQHMRFGSANGDANALILATCQSMHLCVWQAHGYDAMFAGAFNIVNGFHGLSYDNSTNTYLYGLYVQGAQYDGIGDDWVDLLTRDLDLDQCATTMVAGTTYQALDNQYYNGGFMDFKSTAPYNGGSKYYYINGCNPDDGDEL